MLTRLILLNGSKAQANLLAIDERQSLESLTREEKTTARSLNQLQQKYEGFSERREKVAEDGKAQSVRKAEVSPIYEHYTWIN